MARHNNTIPNGHFHKNWQKFVKTRFSQPLRKVKRSSNRQWKLLKSLPRPVMTLRPIIHCTTVRYNRKVRAGRGFTLEELKQAGINRNFGKTIGISIDYRRRNRSLEALRVNVQRLKNYRNKLILFPIHGVIQTILGRDLNKIRKVEKAEEARILTDEDRKFPPFTRKHKRSKITKNVK